MKVALQTYSVRRDMSKDVPGTLENVSKLGYKSFEVSNHDEGKPYHGENDGIGFGVGPKEIKELMERLGTTIMGVHLFPFPFDDLDEILAYHKILGTKYIAIPNAFFNGMDDIKSMISKLNKVGEKCKKEGFELVYHNHFHEFQKWQGKTILDHLMDETDSDAVGLELDTVWAYMAGENIVEVMQKYNTRIKLIHQKDFNKYLVGKHNLLARFKDDKDYISLHRMIECITDIGRNCFVEIGTGVIDIQAIINAGNEYCQNEYIILEQDYTEHKDLESVRISMDHLKKYTGIEW